MRCESAFSKGLSKIEIIAIAVSFPQEVEVPIAENAIHITYTGPRGLVADEAGKGEIIFVIGEEKMQGEIPGIRGGMF